MMHCYSDDPYAWLIVSSDTFSWLVQGSTPEDANDVY